MEEISKKIKELELKAERYDEIKANLDVKIEEINKHIEVIKDIIKYLNPSISMRESATRNKRTGFINKIAEEIVKFIKESDDTFIFRDLWKQFNITSGGNQFNIIKILSSTPGVRVELTPGFNRKKQVRWVGERVKVEGTLTEKVKSDVTGEGYIDEEGTTKIPKKFSYMR